MSKEGKSRKPLVVGIIAAVVVLAGLLGVLLTQCTGGQGGVTTPTGDNATVSTTAPVVVEDVKLYWNVDRAEFDGMSESGMTSRKPESDGYYHVRFFVDGQMVELKVGERRLINAIDVNDLMGLVLDEEGIVVDMIHIDDMPVQQVGWKFYVQSVGGGILKLNSAKTLKGMEVLLEITDQTGIWDMSGMSPELGTVITPTNLDRVIAIANNAGELTHVFVYDRSEFMQKEKGYCEHCLEDVEWILWNKENELPNSTGHYKLQNNIKLAKQSSLPEDCVMCWDLNGFAVDGADGKRVLSLHNVGVELALMDTSEAKTGVIRGHGTLQAQGGVVWVRYGQFHMYSGTVDGSDVVNTLNGAAMEVRKDAYFYMYGGTIIGGTAKYSYNEQTKKYGHGVGGAINLAGKMVMNGGEIRDGVALGAISGWDNSGKPKYTRGIGGNIYLSGAGELEIHGGTIKNGSATHSGGNIYIDGTTTVLMDGGTVTGGHVNGVGRNGGNIFVNSKATLTLNGGYVVNGYSYNCAANLYVGGTCNMNGGYIGGGRCYDAKTGKVKNEQSTNIYVVNGQFHMYGGEIKGGFKIIDTNEKLDKALLVLGGLAQIWGSDNEAIHDLHLDPSNGGVKVVVAKLMDGAKIGVYATTGVFTRATDETNTDNFFSNIEGSDVVWTEKGLAIGRYSCVCGVKSEDPEDHLGTCGNEQLYWKPITGSAMPTEAGNYYLVKDITQKAQLGVPADATVRFDLNGYTLNANPNYRAFTTNSGNENSKLVITDTSEAKTGTVKTTGHGASQGNLVWITKGSFDLYGGTLDGSEYTLHSNWNSGEDGVYGTKDDKAESRKGGGLVLTKNTVANIYGGKIIGNKLAVYEDIKTVTVEENGEKVKKEVKRSLGAGTNGATVYTEGAAVINLYDGEILGGTATTPGGNIYLAGSSVLNMYGGKAVGGVSSAQGGNIVIYDMATLNVLGSDVLIADGVAAGNGGNIWFGKPTAKMTMSGGTISGGTSSDQGGNIFCTGALTVTGGSVVGGSAKLGGNIGINSAYTVSLAGVEITGGSSTGNGGNIAVNTTAAEGEVVIGEGTVVTGGNAGGSGGNIYLGTNNSVYNNAMKAYEEALKEYEKSLESTDPTAETLAKPEEPTGKPAAIMTMSGGTVSGGTAVGDGNNIYVKNNGNSRVSDVTLNLNGGTIDGEVRLATDSIVVNITGAPVIHAQSGVNLFLNGAVMNVPEKLADGAKIGITGGGRISGETPAANRDKFVSDDTALLVEHVDQCLYIGLYDCLCRSPKGTCMGGNACSGEEIFWQPWYSKTTLPTEDGNYYLCEDVALSAFYVPPKNLNLDLNGHGISANKNRVIRVDTKGTQLTITDGSASGEGKIWKNDTYKGQGSLIWLRGSNITVTLLAGTLDGTGSSNAYDAGEKFGGLVCVNDTGTFTMYGGTITGGNFTAAYGGNICSTGTVNILGGTVSNGHSTKGGNINIADGTLTVANASITGGVSTQWGGNIDINGSGKLTIGGSTETTVISGGVAAKNGGNIRIDGADAELEMSGGSVTGGVTSDQGGNLFTSGKTTITGGSITGGQAMSNSGGNIAINSKYVVTLENVTITGGQAKTGGNISCNSTQTAGEILIKGSTTITGGTATGNGGNIYVAVSNYNIGSAARKVTLTVESGTVSGGTASGNGANIWINDQSGKYKDQGVVGTLNIKGGTIDGGVHVSSATMVVNISGAPTISGTGIKLSGAKMNVGTMTGGSVIVNAPEGTVLSTETAAANAAYFDALDTAFDVGHHEGVLVLGIFDCICRSPNGVCINVEGVCTGEQVFWQPWTATDSLPGHCSTLQEGTTDKYEFDTSFANKKRYFYLKNDVTLTKQQIIHAASNVATIGIDLNGHTVKNDSSKNIRLLWLQGKSLKLYLIDSVGTGMLYNSSTYTQGGIIYQNSGSTVMNLIGVKLDASDYKIKSAATNGAAVYMGGGNVKLNMYGGSIVGGEVQNGGAIYAKHASSPVYVNIYNGTITGGTAAANGGAIYVETARGEIVLSGATVTGGSAVNGGAIYTTGNITMTNSTVSGGVASENGGNIYSSGTLTINSGTVSGGVASENGGNIYTAGTLTVNGGTITAIETTVGEETVYAGASAANGGNIYAASGASAKLNGGTVSRGTAATAGGNIYNAGTLTVDGGSVDKGKATGNTAMGGNIYNAGTLTISGGTVSDGVAYQGGNIYDAGVVTISGTKSAEGQWSTVISGGQAAHSGGNIFSTGNVTMNSGHLTAGRAGRDANGDDLDTENKRGWGGNADIRGIFTMYGGEISNGLSECNGGNLRVVGTDTIFGELYIYGGTVRDGQSVADQGGNIFNSYIMTIQGTADQKVQILNGQAVNGGNIVVNSARATNITYADISGGQTTGDGGSFRINSSQASHGAVILGEGTTISGGKAAKNGANIYVYAAESKSAALTLNGASVGQTAADNTASAIYINSHDSGNVSLNLNGAQLTPAVNVTKAAIRVNVSGNTAVTLNLKGQALNVTGALAEGAGITVTHSEVTLDQSGKFVLATGAGLTYADKNRITCTNEGYQKVFMDGVLYLMDANVHAHCVCGGSIVSGTAEANGVTHICEDIIYTPVSAWNQITTTNASQTFYLNSEDGLIADSGLTIDGKELYLCLNGVNVTAQSDSFLRLFNLKNSGHVVITSCEADITADGQELPSNNVITRSGNVAGNQTVGLFAWVASNSHFEMYRVTVNGGGLTFTNNHTAGKHGPLVLIDGSSENNAKFTMHSGTIVGATTIKGNNSSHGGAVSMVNGTQIVFDMIGGVIRDGNTHQWGGNIHIQKGTFNMYSGEIRGGHAGNEGGNIYNQAGVFNLVNGSIYNGSKGASDLWNTYANICVDSKGVVNMSGGWVKGNIRAKNAGAIVNISGNSRITGEYNDLYVDSKITVNIGNLTENAIVYLRYASGATFNIGAIDSYSIEDEDLDHIVEDQDRMTLTLDKDTNVITVKFSS